MTFTSKGPCIRGRQVQIASDDVTSFALHPGITRPFSTKRTVPLTDTVAVIVRIFPFAGEDESVSVTKGMPTPTVMVTPWVAVAPT